MISTKAEAMYLSSQLNCPVKVPNRLENHLIYIRRSKSNPMVELNAVAASLRARVVKIESGGYGLERTPEDDRKYEDAWTEGRVPWMEKVVKRAEKYRQDNHADEDPTNGLRRALLIRQNAIDDAWGTPSHANALIETNASQLNPSGRLMLDAIKAVGMSTLAQLPAESYTVFETDPRGDARPLPNFTPALHRYEDLLVALQSFRTPEELRQPMDSSGMLAGVGKVAAPAVCARLSVFAGERELSLTIEAYDANGNAIAIDHFLISAVDLLKSPEQIAKEVMSRNLPGRQTGIPPDLLALTKSRQDSRPPTWAQRPTECEPLSVLASFAMDQLIAPGVKCAVVDMSDRLVRDTPASIESNRLNIDAFRAILDSRGPYEMVEGNGFAAWRPVNPFREECLDRKDLQRFVGSVMDSKYVDVRAMAKVADPWSPLLLESISVVRPFTEPDVDGNGANLPPSGLMRLIRAIDDSGWNALMSGETRTVGQLGITEDLLKLFDDPGTFADSTELAARYRHPAELYVHGGYDKTPIHIASATELVFRMSDPALHIRPRWIMQVYSVTQVSLGAHMVGGVPQMDKTREEFEADCDRRYRFQTGTRDRLQLQIGLPGGNAISCPLPRPIRDVSRELAYSNLPKDLRDRTWNMVCRVAASTLKANTGGG